MKKMLCFLIVYILILSGIEVFAIKIDKKDTINTETMLPANVLVTVKGGFGISVKMESNYLIENTGEIEIYIDGGFIHDI